MCAAPACGRRAGAAARAPRPAWRLPLRNCSAAATPPACLLQRLLVLQIQGLWQRLPGLVGGGKEGDRGSGVLQQGGHAWARCRQGGGQGDRRCGKKQECRLGQTAGPPRAGAAATLPRSQHPPAASSICTVVDSSGRPQRKARMVVLQAGALAGTSGAVVTPSAVPLRSAGKGAVECDLSVLPGNLKARRCWVAWCATAPISPDVFFPWGAPAHACAGVGAPGAMLVTKL